MRDQGGQLQGRTHRTGRAFKKEKSLNNTGKEWEVREATSADEREVTQLVTRAGSATLNTIRQPTLKAVVVQTQEKMIGYAALRDKSGKVHLTNVIVDPERERAGVGRAVTESLCRWAAKRGQRVHATVPDNSPGMVHILKTIGFMEVGRVNDPVTGQPGAKMTLDPLGIRV